MNIGQIFDLQIIGSLILFTLIAWWYWVPRLSSLSLMDALTPLLLLHVSRTIGLIMIVSSVVDPRLPRSFAVPAAYGDLIAAGLALASIAALHTRFRFATAVVWLFSVEGIGDLINALIRGAQIELPKFRVGPAWYIYTVLVPALFVTHAMIVIRLVRHARESRLRRGKRVPGASPDASHASVESP